MILVQMSYYAMIIRKASLFALQILLPTMLVAMPVTAAKAKPETISAYQMSTGQAKDFRLHAKVAGSSAYRYRGKQLPISVQLSDKPYASLIQKAAYEAALDPVLVHALIFVESGYNSAALSNKGAVGLMQVLPETAARYGVPDPGRSAEANLMAGTRYLSDLMQQFDGRLELVLAAYNAGENAVSGYGLRIPPFSETQRYVPAVLAKYYEWGGRSGQSRIEYLPGTRRENSRGVR